MLRLKGLVCLLSLAFPAFASAVGAQPAMDMSGKTALVTGSTSGPGRAIFEAGDLGSLEEVRQLAARIRADHARLHLLVNNAGILGAAGADRQRRLHRAETDRLR